jgi:hypothetical protein
MYHTRTGTNKFQGEPRKQRQGDNTLLHGRQYKTHGIPRTKLTTQSKRDQKVTKWSVQILENNVGRTGFGELPVTLWKEVPEEIR